MKRVQTAISRAAVILLLLLFSCAPNPKHPVVYSTSGHLIDPRIVHGTLGNGFQYVLLKNETPRDRVNVHLNVFAGSMHETDKEQGLAHYLEHMLFNGSEHFEPGRLIEYFQEIGMDFGADANAHTGFFNTVYDLSLPAGDAKYLNDAFLVIQDYAKGALLLPEEIDRERGIILAEKRERDSVSYRTFKKTLSFELPGARYPSRLPIGEESIINSAGRKELKTFYDRWYRPDNMVLVVVGDFDVNTAKKMIIKRFASLTPRKPAAPAALKTKWVPHKGIKTFYHHEPEAGNTEVVIETLTWKPFEPETLDVLRSDTLKRLANLMLANRLDRMVTRQTADFSEANAYSGTYLRHVSVSAVSATCEAANWETTLSQLENSLRQALDAGFSEKEFARVTADYIAMLESEAKQEATQKSDGLAGNILSVMNRKGLLLSARQKKEILVPYIRGLSVDDAYAVFKRSWEKDHRLVLVTGNAGIDMPDPEAYVSRVYQKAAGQKLEKYTGFASKPFPYLSIPDERARILSRKDNLENLGINRIMYDNNVSVSFKKTDFKKNQLMFNIVFGSGKKAEPADKQGLSYLAETVIQASGLGSLDPDQLNDALAGKTLQSGFNIREDHFSLAGTAAPDEAELVFQLIYHFFNDPGIRPEALKLSKSRYQQEYDSLLRTPDGIMHLFGNRFLAGNDSRFGLPAPQKMSSYRLEDLKVWLLPYFKQSPIEMNIVGDFDEKTIAALADKYLAAFPPRLKRRGNTLSESRINFPGGRQKKYGIQTKIDSGAVHLVFLTDDIWDIKQTRRLSVLSKVVSERLRIVIREELGAAYSPYAYNMPSTAFKNYGLLHIVVHVKPENHDFVYAKIRRIVDDIKKEGVREKEVELVLKPVLNHIKVYRSTNRYWLNSVLTNASLYPQKLLWAKTMAADYAQISSADLDVLAEKYLRLENSAVIFIKQESDEEYASPLDKRRVKP